MQTQMTPPEMMDRALNLQAWLRNNATNPNFVGVAKYSCRLINEASKAD